MAIEHEIKLLGIHVDSFRDFLLKNGAVHVADLKFIRIMFDTIPFDENAWVRLRTDGTKTTLSFKKSHADAIDGMQEIETIVSDFDATKELLEHAGLKSRNYQENKREAYKAFDCEITIDYWPNIQPYVEIEADTKEKVEQCLTKFSGLYESTTSKSAEEVYREQGIDLRSIDRLAF